MVIYFVLSRRTSLNPVDFLVVEPETEGQSRKFSEDYLDRIKNGNLELSPSTRSLQDSGTSSPSMKGGRTKWVKEVEGVMSVSGNFLGPHRNDGRSNFCR